MPIFPFIMTILVGGYAAFLANQGIAVIQHETRSIYHTQETELRKALFQASWKAALPLALGLALPLSIATFLLSGYLVLLAGEVLGLFFSKNKQGMVFSALAGAAFSAVIFVLFFGLKTYVPGWFSIDFLTPLTGAFLPLSSAFALIPALAIGIQFGPKKAIAASLIIIIVYILFLRLGTISFLSGRLSAIGIAFIVGIVLYYLLTLKIKKNTDPEDSLTHQAESNFPLLKKQGLFLIPMGIMIGMMASDSSFALDPLSHVLLADGFRFEAGWAVLALGLTTIQPLYTSARISGVYSPIGTGLAIALGYWSAVLPGVFGLVAAGVLGGGAIVFELWAGDRLHRYLHTHPVLIKMGDNVRKASLVVMDYTIFVGSMVIGNIIYPVVGFMWVLAAWVIHRTLPQKIFHPITVGPISLLLLGLVVNLLRLLRILI